MKFCDVLYLILQVFGAFFLSGLLMAKELFFCIVPRKQKSVKDEVVLVTGAGHGLGRRIAIILGRLGAHVVCWDKNQETNINTVYDIRHGGGRAVAYTCDVRDRQAVLDTADKVRREVGPVTMLINNAGIYPVRAVVDWEPHELKDLFDTNIMAHFWTLKAFLPSMIEQNYGHIVAIASAAAIAPVANEVPYSSSKAAVSVLMDGMVQELRLNPKNKVKVSCVHPYYTAVRDDIPVKFDLRIERLNPDYVAAEIVKGIRQDREAFSVPRFMFPWIAFLRCVPQQARNMWRDIFYTYVWPIPLSEMPNANRDTVVVVNDKIYPEITSPVEVPASTEGRASGVQSNNTSSEDNNQEVFNNGINLGFSSELDFENTKLTLKIPEGSSINGSKNDNNPVKSENSEKAKTLLEDNAAKASSSIEVAKTNDLAITIKEQETEN